jgi:cytochrome c biogenesis protein CcmG/thiol:disulfide interchange protein DsbE
MKIRYLIPLFLFIGIALILWRGLSQHPSQVPSPLINKPAPTFHLPSLFNEKITTSLDDFKGSVRLLNVWASWCYACAEEHDFLLELSHNHDFILYGFNYKDTRNAATTWLEQHGNPYQTVAMDASGEAAIDWGVYGAPETFVIDKKGIIRYKQIGPITADVWEHELKPLIDTLREEP